jgi:hypothetical protein
MSKNNFTLSEADTNRLLKESAGLKLCIAELEARMILAMRVNYANYPGYVTTALLGNPIPDKVLKYTDAICKNEEYFPTLEKGDG